MAIDPMLAAVFLAFINAGIQYLKTNGVKPEDEDAYYNLAKTEFDKRDPMSLPDV